VAIPDVVPIVHEPDYRTGTIGHYDKGQFFGSVTATLEDGAGAEDDWYRHKRWYAVLHRFDADGQVFGQVFGLVDWSAEYDGNDHGGLPVPHAGGGQLRVGPFALLQRRQHPVSDYRTPRVAWIEAEQRRTRTPLPADETPGAAAISIADVAPPLLLSSAHGQPINPGGSTPCRAASAPTPAGVRSPPAPPRSTSPFPVPIAACGTTGRGGATDADAHRVRRPPIPPGSGGPLVSAYRC
jgi:hypothetical protein